MMTLLELYELIEKQMTSGMATGDEIPVCVNDDDPDWAHGLYMGSTIDLVDDDGEIHPGFALFYSRRPSWRVQEEGEDE